MIVKLPDSSPVDRNRRKFGEMRGNNWGFTLIEVLAAIVVLGVVGAATTHLVLRLTEPRALTVRYEQVSLAARTAAEQIWDLFTQIPAAAEEPPAACLPASDDPPAGGDFGPIDDNFEFAFRCGRFEEDGQESQTLYRVRVWLRRSDDKQEVGKFDMLALLGGYGRDENP